MSNALVQLVSDARFDSDSGRARAVPPALPLSQWRSAERLQGLQCSCRGSGTKRNSGGAVYLAGPAISVSVQPTFFAPLGEEDGRGAE